MQDVEVTKSLNSTQDNTPNSTPFSTTSYTTSNSTYHFTRWINKQCIDHQFQLTQGLVDDVKISYFVIQVVAWTFFSFLLLACWLPSPLLGCLRFATFWKITFLYSWLLRIFYFCQLWLPWNLLFLDWRGHLDLGCSIGRNITHFFNVTVFVTTFYVCFNIPHSSLGGPACAVIYFNNIEISNGMLSNKLHVLWQILFLFYALKQWSFDIMKGQGTGK